MSPWLVHYRPIAANSSLPTRYPLLLAEYRAAGFGKSPPARDLTSPQRRLQIHHLTTPPRSAGHQNSSESHSGQ